MTDQELLESTVGDKLRGLRRALRRRLAGEGLSWLVLTLVALVFVTLAFDYGLRLNDRVLRGIVMALSLWGVLWVAWRQLAAPLRVPMGREQLALLIERRYDRLGDRLISALQFAGRRDDAAPGESRAMMSRVAAQAAELAADLDFRAVVERPMLRKRMAAAACAAALLAGFCVWQSDVMRLWLWRNVAFADVAWPQDIYLDVSGPGMDENGNFRVPRGEDLPIAITARPGRAEPPAPAPSEITLHARYRSVGWTEDQVALSENVPRTYTMVFRNVSEPFRFYFTGGDDRRRITHRVYLIEPPGLTWLRFKVEYPEYMNRPAQVFDAARTVLGVPPGSRVGISATADKNLHAAAVFLDSQKVTDLEIAGGTSLEGGFRVPGLERKKGPKKSMIRTLRIVLRDSEGFENAGAARYKIRIEPDLSPRVTVRKRGVGGAITPMALLPLFISAKDDNGLGAVRVEAVWSGGAAERDGAAKPEGESWLVEPGPDGKREFERFYKADLAGLGLAPGQTLRVHASGDDLMPADLDGPNTGESGTLIFRIVKRDELLAEMVRKQKALRAAFEQAVRTQEDAIAKTDAVIAITSAGEITLDARRQLKDAGGLQVAVGGECATTADSLQAILTEMIYNRIIESKGRSDMADGIIAPLGRLAKRIEKLTAEIRAAEGAPDAADMFKQTSAVDTEQRGILALMREILERMVKIAEAQELAYKLERLIERWDKIMRDTERRRDAEIGNVLEPATKPATRPGTPTDTP